MYHRAEMTSSEALPHNLPDDSIEPEFEAAEGNPTEPSAAAESRTASSGVEDGTRSGEPAASTGVAPAAEPAPAEAAPPEPGFHPVYWTPPTPEAAPADTPPPNPGFQPVYWTPGQPSAPPDSPEAATANPEPAPPAPASPEATSPTPEPAPPAPEEPEAAAPAAEAVGAAATSMEVERLRLEIAHRDQMLLVARERRLGLEREIGRLERQLDGAIEAQREAATERAELRRLLGNVQLQVQSLLQLPPPSGEYEDVGEAPDVASEHVEPAPPPRSRRPGPRTPEQIIYAPPAGSSELPTTGPPVEPPPRGARPQRRGLAADARGVLSSLRRLF